MPMRHAFLRDSASWNGLRLFGEHPRPKMAAARMCADERSRNHDGDTETQRHGERPLGFLVCRNTMRERVSYGVGILRLRRTIREANRSAALRMTGHRLTTAESGCPEMFTVSVECP